jgi:hypothetical protein
MEQLLLTGGQMKDKKFTFFPKAGDQFGTTDGVKASRTTAYHLSRVLDIIGLAKEIGHDQEIWHSLPEVLRFKFNWGSWSYQPRLNKADLMKHLKVEEQPIS